MTELLRWGIAFPTAGACLHCGRPARQHAGLCHWDPRRHHAESARALL